MKRLNSVSWVVMRSVDKANCTRVFRGEHRSDVALFRLGERVRTHILRTAAQVRDHGAQKAVRGT